MAERYAVFAVPFDLYANLFFADLLAAVFWPIFAAKYLSRPIKPSCCATGDLHPFSGTTCGTFAFSTARTVSSPPF